MKNRVVGWVVFMLTLAISSPSLFAGQIIATTMSGWSSAAVSIGDMQFTLSNYSGIDATDSVSFVSDSTGLNYVVSIGNLVNNVPSSIILNYTVQVLSANSAITSVDMDTDVPFHDVTVSKSFYNENGSLAATLASNGSPMVVGTLPSTFFSVNVTATGNSAGSLFSLSDSYHQQIGVNPHVTAPEPSSFALIGLGGLGVFVGRRMLRKE